MCEEAGGLKQEDSKDNKKFFTYLLRCADGTLYCGSTTDLKKRVAAHNAGRGAKYTRARRPVKLVYFEEQESWSAALRREAAIKKMSRPQKDALLKAHD